jgi:HAD superfamily hydrolase (TIGR01509 family)
MPSETSSAELTIFDCDGVLVDSEVIANRVFCAMLNEIGLSVSLDDMFEKFVGRSMKYCYELIADLLKRPMPDEFDTQLKARTVDALKAELKAVRGIAEVLDELDERGLRYCVASSGTHEKMQTTLGITGLLPRFNGRLYSVTEVAHAKPAPDVFFYAAAKNGVSPARCRVVEDSPTGVKAGVAAGMTVFGYAGLTPRQQLIEAGAHVVVNDMSELRTLWFGEAV